MAVVAEAHEVQASDAELSLSLFIVKLAGFNLLRIGS